MNLRIDLILESEQRSASLLDLKALKRMGMVIGPAILVVIVLFAILRATQQGRVVANLESKWQTEQPLVAEADKWQTELVKTRDVNNEFEGWRKSRINWHEQIIKLAEITPNDIQLTGFRMSHSLQRGRPVRMFSVTLDGKTSGEDAEAHVQTLLRKLEEQPEITRVQIMDFRADATPDAQRHDRIFRLELTYRERPIE